MNIFFNKSGITKFFIVGTLLLLLVFTGGCAIQSPPVNSSSNNSVDVNGSSQVVWKPVSLSVDNYSLIASMPIEGSKVMTYVPEEYGFTRENVSILAKNLGIPGAIKETENSFSYEKDDSPQFLFVVQKKTSDIYFRGPYTRPGANLSNIQPVPAATAFLFRNHLLPSEDYQSRIAAGNPIVVFDRSGNRVNQMNKIDVVYSQKVDGLPVFNAQFNVEVSSTGNIFSMSRNWRDYSPYKEVSLRSPEDAFREFRSMQLQDRTGLPEQETIDEVNATGVRFGYRLRETGSAGDHLEPVYLFEGYYRHGNTTEDFQSDFINATHWKI